MTTQCMAGAHLCVCVRCTATSDASTAGSSNTVATRTAATFDPTRFMNPHAIYIHGCAHLCVCVRRTTTSDASTAGSSNTVATATPVRGGPCATGPSPTSTAVTASGAGSCSASQRHLTHR
eukprot:TRINITY_DN257_c0_g1_i5.p1 TRINITY_DN257_c0_g1~~TRINITY_DN257_c0_g1_i5.p1  ORF type:complete len:121 (-),score=6.14 TRINITY_DN257_c0_g1_i5:486-848(-)